MRRTFVLMANAERTYGLSNGGAAWGKIVIQKLWKAMMVGERIGNIVLDGGKGKIPVLVDALTGKKKSRPSWSLITDDDLQAGAAGLI